MPALLRRVPSAVAVLLGEGSERRRLEKAAERLGVARSVRFPGAVANRELPSWFRSASIILSLLDRTNASNPVFEAMACERCVVALDTGTTREVIIPERTGVLVPAGGVSGLGDLLADLLDDHERRDRLGREARAHIRSLLLDPPARMDQEIAILLDVIGGARR
ncbi:MAG: glycosyltransferase [Candidatus Eisenbacteria bacterium]|nr:glycosyltransferase [Candidatus Eisenbacteria bacterium]